MRSVALTTPAIRRHLSLLHAAYHGTPVLVSLLEHKGDEAILASALSAALASLGPDSPPVKFVPLDLKAACRAGRDQGVRAAVGHLAHYAAAVGHWTGRLGPGESLSVSRRQAGVIRVSCLDCLSRTHLMLTALALHGAAGQMYELFESLVGGAAEAVARACEPPLLAALQRMWAEAGDAISMQYAGAPHASSALGSSAACSFLGVARFFSPRAFPFAGARFCLDWCCARGCLCVWGGVCVCVRGFLGAVFWK